MGTKVLHGKKHRWEIKGDYVLDRKRGRILTIRRLEQCDSCSRTRTEVIDIITGERIGARGYSGEVIPMEDRMSDEEERLHLIATTSPDVEIRNQLNKKR